MELKVWCDGIQRIVCGATISTTCQDVVFALAHATGQTGRFILIEKWKNNERVLAPSDQPLISLAKWGEFANDVTFVMKKSGDVSSSNKSKQTPKLSKKSDLVQKRKKPNLENFPKFMSSIESSTTPSSQFSLTSNMREVAHNVNNNSASPRIRMNTTSSQQQIEGHAYLSIKDNYNRPNYFNSFSSESLYGSLNKNRPRQPPPYKEAIAKSSLVNINSSSSFNPNTFDHNYATSINMGSSQNILYNKPNENLNQPQVKMFYSEKINNNTLTSSNENDRDSLSMNQKKTISLISIQQKTLKKQGKNMANLENEIDLVQRKLSENELIINRYKDEMEFLRQKWNEQETLIKKLESENLEQELEKLINDGKHYEEEMKEIKLKLSNCENEVIKRRDEICILMNKIEDHLQLNLKEIDNLNYSSLMERFKFSIQEKTDKIQNQKIDLDVMNDSLEHFDQTIQSKNNIVDELINQIKEANVEGLSLQSSIIPVEEKNSYIDASHLKSGTNRRIPVSLHELGNTVPTKKNPAGIWV